MFCKMPSGWRPTSPFFWKRRTGWKKFNSAIDNLTPDDAKFLAEMIRTMLLRTDM